MNSIYQPYTYLVGWSHLDLWYYGVRYGRNCHPTEFWQTYFTSSNYVAEMRTLYGEPDIIQIRRQFKFPEKAMTWERKVLRRLRVDESTRWLNKTAGTWPLKIMSDESKMKLSVAHKGKSLSDEHRKKISASLKGRRRSVETKQKISSSHTGKTLTESHKLKLSVLASNRSDVTRSKFSIIGKTRTGTNNHFYGRTHSDETKQIMSEKAKARKKK